MSGGAIVAIDPGARHTGIVYMDRRRVIDARTVSFPKGVGTDNDLLEERCSSIWRQVEGFLALHPHDEVVIEGFVPYPGMKVARSTSHQTPWLVGYLMHGLESAGERAVIQTSKQVLNPRTRGNLATQKEMLEMGRYVYEGQDLLTNDHLRCAFVHGLYRFTRGGDRLGPL